MQISWGNAGTLGSKAYTCGYCGNPIASNQGYVATPPGRGERLGYIYICHFCWQPTYFDSIDRQFPGATFGEKVKHIPSSEVEALYNEARNSFTVNAFTASAHCGRKLLMNIAVTKGATVGLSYLDYVNYLETKGFVPPDGKEWVDHIRKKGNEAAHEIAIMGREDAEDLITFVGALLKFLYEYPGILAERKKKT